jgi:hypothetical protein
MILLQFMGLLVYKMSYMWAVLVVILILVDVLFHFLENKFKRIDQLRLLSLLTCVTVLGIFFSPSMDINFNPGLSRFFQSIGYYFLLFASLKDADWLKINILLLGLLLATNEANILIRCFFQLFQLDTKNDVSSNELHIIIPEKREYNAGRVIGILERALIYFLVLNAQYAAIGFILAAKSFTRFKELEKREFAEYVLIGTLLSAFLAMATAGMTKLLLP